MLSRRLWDVSGEANSSDFKASPIVALTVSMHLSVNRLTDPAAIQEIAAEWEQLDALSVPRTPFSSPAWNALWWKHYRRQDSFAVDGFFMHAIRAGRQAHRSSSTLYTRVPSLAIRSLSIRAIFWCGFIDYGIARTRVCA